MRKLIGGLMVVTLISPLSLFAEVKVGGKVLANGYIQYLTKEVSPTGEAYWDFNEALHPFTRFNIKATSEDVTAFVEMGVNSAGPSTRHAWLSWKLNDKSNILVGHTWSILDFVFPAQQMFVKGILGLGYGNLYGDRFIQVRYETVISPEANIKIAACTPTIKGDITESAKTKKAMFPKIEAAVNYKTGPANIDASLSFNSYTLVDAVSSTDTTDLMVNSLAGALVGKTKIEPVNIILNAYGGLNLFAYPFQSGFHTPYYDGTDIKNAIGFGGFAQIVYPLSPEAKVGIGGGIDYAKEPVEDAWTETDTDSTKIDTRNQSFGFVNLTYELAKGLSIVPEVTLVTYGNETTELMHRGMKVYPGVFFQYNF